MFLQVTKKWAASGVFLFGWPEIPPGDPRALEVGLMLPEGCSFVPWGRYVWELLGFLEGFCLCFWRAYRFYESPGRDRRPYLAQDAISPPGG